MAKQEPQRRKTIDPTVADILGRAEERQAEVRLPPKEREKKRREREKIRARREKRTTYDLPPALKGRVAAFAAEHKVPASQVAALLLTLGFEALERGEIDIEALKTPTKTPRYEHNLDLDKLK